MMVVWIATIGVLTPELVCSACAVVIDEIEYRL